MNTETSLSNIFTGVAAAVAALALTWVLSWSFVDSTRVARWVSATDVAAAAAVSAKADTATLAGAIKAGLLQ
jgi:hypothetical protein